MKFSSGKKLEASALLHIFSSCSELEDRALKSLDDKGFFEVSLFQQQTEDLEGTNKVFAQLAISLFNKKPFPLETFNDLSMEQLNTAFEAIRLLKKDKGIYEIDEQKPMILKENTVTHPPTFLGQTQVADMLKDNGIDMDRRKIAVYYKRGHLPEPNVLIGSAPGWKQEAIEKWIKDYEAGRILERRNRK